MHQSLVLCSARVAMGCQSYLMSWRYCCHFLPVSTHLAENIFFVIFRNLSDIGTLHWYNWVGMWKVSTLCLQYTPGYSCCASLSQSMQRYCVCTCVMCMSSVWESYGEKQFTLGIIFYVIMYRNYKLSKLMHFLLPSWYIHRTSKKTWYFYIYHSFNICRDFYASNANSRQWEALCFPVICRIGHEWHLLLVQ